jgi:uncharacterized protein
VKKAPEHRFREAPPGEPRAGSKAPRKRPPARTERCREVPPQELLQAIEEFNRGEFFEQHETLEAIWIAQPDPIRYLYQGILQVGVGFYHWSRGNWKGAVAKLGQGLEKLDPYRPDCQTVDVERLCLETRFLLDQLRTRPEGDLPPFPPPGLPRIHRLAG